MSEFPIRAGDVLIVLSKEPSAYYQVGRVHEDGQYCFKVTSRFCVKKTEAAAEYTARDLARVSTCNILFKMPRLASGGRLQTDDPPLPRRIYSWRRKQSWAVGRLRPGWTEAGPGHKTRPVFDRITSSPLLI